MSSTFAEPRHRHVHHRDDQSHRGHSIHSQHSQGTNGSSRIGSSQHQHRHRQQGSQRSRNHSPRSSSSSFSSPEASFRDTLSTLNLPSGLLSSVLENYHSCDSRLWLLDNSSKMKVHDSHVGRGINQHGSGNNNVIIEKVDNVTRWEELQETVAFHAKMASKCWIPTKFWLVNPDEGARSAGASHGYKFSLCCDAHEDVPDEITDMKHIMKHTSLNHSACPLSSRVRSLAKGISHESSNLTAKEKRVTVVICTQGLPTDVKGKTCSSVRKEFIHELAELSKLPVKVIIRLCTDDDNVRDIFNTMDSRFDSFDVLDDFWGEALEVYLHNPWLTYSIGLHRLREAGLAPEVLDDIDERPLTLDDIHQLCQMLFLGEEEKGQHDNNTNNNNNLPHPTRHWNSFFQALKSLMEKEKKQWNPIKKSTMPWINLDKLQAIHHHHNHHRSRNSNSSDHRHHHHHGPHRHGQKGHPNRRASLDHHQYQPHRHGQMGHPNRRASVSQDPPAEHQQQRKHQQPAHQSQPRPHGGHQRQQRGSTFTPQQLSGDKATSHTANNAAKDNLTLTEVLQQWSHRPPEYNKRLNKLQDLLVTVPRTFPPTNTEVEPHEYFAKWKVFDKEAFADESGDELKELLKRASRKAKFFLHPDKLPKDLTENQTLLFKTIWNVITEQEAATLG